MAVAIPLLLGTATMAPDEVDRETLLACKRRDPAALRAFVTRYQRQVFALVSRLSGRGAHVQDLAQETFLRAFSALSSFDVAGPAKVSTWLLTIATRVTLDAKKRRALPVEVLDEQAAPSPSAGPEHQASRAELGRAIAAAVAGLGEGQRETFVLVEVHGFSIAEAASALDVPENTVKQRLFRARERLKVVLSHLDPRVTS